MRSAQRYDVIVTANQAHVADKFWMRAVPQTACSKNNNTDNIRGIVYYGNNGKGTPTTTSYDMDTGCVDETANLSPVVPMAVLENFTYYANESVSTFTNTSNGFILWELNNVSMLVDWQDPSLLQVYNQQHNWSRTANVIEVDEGGEWVYVLLHSSLGATHPIHLHGHDFYILAQGTGTYDPSSSPISDLSNPMRRDTALLLSQGYLLIAFKADNPGVWLMHCHIGFHTVGGLALQFVEEYSQISRLVDYGTMSSNCQSWDRWQDSQHLVDDDDGL